MIVYNVTINIEPAVEQDWLIWMKTEHIPRVMETGFFLNNRMLRLLNEQPDATGTTYAIQYTAADIGKLEEYLEKEAPRLQQESLQAFPNKFVAFRTFLEEV
ncbi:MAG: DUF4286 family protein [Cyclobacteriaceae bacterium]